MVNKILLKQGRQAINQLRWNVNNYVNNNVNNPPATFLIRYLWNTVFDSSLFFRGDTLGFNASDTGESTKCPWVEVVEGTVVACVAWRFKNNLNANTQKTSCEAARNRLPGWPVYFIAAPITYFYNPMTGFVNLIDTANQSTVRHLSLSQAPHGFGAPYRGFPAFLSPSNVLKTAKLRRLTQWVKTPMPRPTASTLGRFVLSIVSLASRNQDCGSSNSTNDIYDLTEK